MLECQQVIYRISILRGLFVPPVHGIGSPGAETFAPARRYLRKWHRRRGNLAGNNGWNCAGRSLNELVLPDVAYSGFRRSRMTPKNVFAAAIGATLLAWSGFFSAGRNPPREELPAR